MIPARGKAAYILVLATLAMSLGSPACGPELDNVRRFVVTLRLDETAQSLSELRMDVTYDEVELCGSDSSAVCTLIGLDPPPASSFDDIEDEEDPGGDLVLRLVLRKAAGMDNDDDLVSCTFASSVTPARSNFVFEPSSALNTGGTALSSTELADLTFTVTVGTGTDGDCSGVGGGGSPATSTTTGTFP